MAEKLSRRAFLRASAGMASGVALLAACAPAPAEAPASSGDAPMPESITLRIGTWDPADSEPIENEIIEAFTDQPEYSHISVEYEFNPDAYTDKLLTSIAGGTAPDIFLWWNFPGLVDKGGIEDLNPYLEGPNGLDTSVYYQPVLDYNRVGDGLYGLPKDFTPRCVFYNKKLFDEAGLDYPSNDWAWDDMLVMAQQMTKGEGADAQYGWFSYTGVYPIQPYVWSNGGDFISPDGTVASGYCDSAETIQAMEWYVSLQREHGVSPTAELDRGSATQQFQNDKLAIYDSGRWPQTQFQDVEGLEFGTVVPPICSFTGNRVTVLHEAGFCMNPQSEYKTDETWELLKWLASPFAHKTRAEAGWALPAMPGVVEELGLLDDPLEKAWFEAVPDATVEPDFMRTPAWGPANSEFQVAIESAFLGEGTVEEVMTAVAPVVDGLLAES